MISYGDYKQKMRKALWPHPGEAESLVEAHDHFFLEAMIDLCKWVRCLQQNHTDVHAACSTYVQCGLTVFAAPYGEIKRVYTIVNGDWCTKVMYEPANFNRVNGWSQRLLKTFVAPANVGWPALQQGFRYPEASTDSVCGRSRAGIYANHRKRLYIAPWLQSNESIVVEWEGVKTNWKDSDLLDETYWTPDVAAAIKLFVLWSHVRDFGIYDTSPGEVNTTRANYESARADLIYWCEQRTREKMEQGENTVFTEGDALPTASEIRAEVPSVSTGTVFAIIGDFGDDDQEEVKLAALVKSWDPAFIVTSGDNWYGPLNGLGDLTLSSLDQVVGKYFQEFIFPYIGSYGSGGDAQALHVCLGNHDFDPVGRRALELQYFNLAKSYYTVVKGPVQFFLYDSGYDSSQVNQEPDGIALGSVQALWLQAQLALSTAQFRVVVLHHPPFTSCKSSILVPPLAGDGTLSYPALRLPFKDWGADAVISGHAHLYERLLHDGIPYIINGAGGRSGTMPEEPALFADTLQPESVVRYNSAFGAQRCVVDCSSLTMQFINFDGELIDEVVISK